MEDYFVQRVLTKDRRGAIYTVRNGDTTFRFKLAEEGLFKDSLIANDTSKVTKADWDAAREAIAKYERANLSNIVRG